MKKISKDDAHAIRTEYEEAVEDLKKAINELAVSKKVNTILRRYKGNPPFDVLKAETGLDDKTVSLLIIKTQAPNDKYHLLPITRLSDNIHWLKIKVSKLEQKLPKTEQVSKFNLPISLPKQPRKYMAYLVLQKTTT